ncbi:jg987, partial [Pararge aegeria aegeria]
MNLTYFIIGLATLNLASCHVLRQVRKSDNRSNVDAVIHKVVPAKKYEKIENTARKHFKDYNKFKIKSQTSVNDLESFVLAIKTNDDKKNYGRRENNKVDNVWTNIKDVVMNFIEPDVNRPNLRSRAEKYNK